jgi:LEA14-like dessication related protein
MRILILTATAVLALVGCASLRTEPPRVTVEGFEPAVQQAADQRLQLKLRVQNPNDTSLEYNGLYVELIVQGKTLASGVSSQGGALPAFGEQLFTVPMSVSVMSVVSGVMSLLHSSAGAGHVSLDSITYEMRGKLGTVPFKAQGQMSMPGTPTPGAEST